MSDPKSKALASRGAEAAEAEVSAFSSLASANSSAAFTIAANQSNEKGDPPSFASGEKDEENQAFEKAEGGSGSMTDEPQSSRPSQTKKKFLPGVPRVLNNKRSNMEANADTVKKSNAMHRTSGLPLPGPFMNLKNKTEGKVVGLGNYGLGQSFLDRRQNEWLTSTRSINSHPPSIYPSSSAAVPPPPTNITTTSANNTQQDETTAAPEGDTKKVDLADVKAPPAGAPFKHPPSLHAMASLLPPPLTKKKSVEELEEMARERAIMNPFKLLYLGNVAALKVFGYYLITLETFITCALVRQK
jgi:hypothetical protein